MERPAFFRLVYPLLFFIPLNIFILGENAGFGIQWIFVRYQETVFGPGLFSFLSPVYYILNGILTGKTAAYEIVLLGAILLLIIAFVLLQNLVNGDPGIPGLLTILGGLLVLLADILQTGLFFYGPAGTYIPIGVPLLLVLGWLMVKEGFYLPPASQRRELFWKTLYCTLAVLLIAANMSQIASDLSGSAKNGWDFMIYIGAADAVNAGKDPYLLDNTVEYANRNYAGTGVQLDTRYGFAYPPYTLLMFQGIAVLYHHVHSMGIYYVVLLLLLILSAVIIIKTTADPDHILLVLLLLTAFSGVYWNFMTGNFAFLYLVLTSLFFYSLCRGRYLLSSLVMGLFGSFAIFPLIFNGVWLAVPALSLKRKASWIILSVAITAAILVISYWLNPALFASYLRLMAGGTTPASEITLSAYRIIADLFALTQLHSPLIISLAILIYISIIAGISYLYLRTNPGSCLIACSFITLALFLLLPRIMLYYFAILIVPVYFILKDEPLPIRCVCLVIVSMIPQIRFFFNWEHVTGLSGIVFHCVQTFSLAIFFAFICLVWYFRYRRASRIPY